MVQARVGVPFSLIKNTIIQGFLAVWGWRHHAGRRAVGVLTFSGLAGLFGGPGGSLFERVHSQFKKGYLDLRENVYKPESGLVVLNWMSMT